MNQEKGGQMKELDLDELHQQVSKLMDQTGKAKPKRQAAKSEPKPSPRPSVKVTERPVAKVAAKPAASDKGETIAVRRPSAVKVLPKRRGIAMDVVQAAKEPPIKPPSSRAGRTAPTLQPTGSVTAEQPQPAPSRPQAQEQKVVAAPAPVQPTTTEDVSDDTLAAINLQADGTAPMGGSVPAPHPAVRASFPDPLEVHGFADTPAKQKETPAPEPAPELQTASEKSWDPLLDEPQEPAPQMSEPPATPAANESASPFVNAKVQKRPLGAFAATTPPSAVEPEPAPAPEEPKDTPDVPEPAPAEVQASPQELSPEVLAVESAELEHPATSSVDQLRGTSIPQQYHATETSVKQDDRPVFDTKNYHTPLQPGAGRPHGSRAGSALTIVLILLLVVAGVAAYFVATGSIDLRNIM
ncbi:MAG TPA: hypothetical protein VFO38_02735 [Candidatus Saccharimonadales bacterium]|nr:hypothetical protein [Candidatus Saccharimonadales bacterium]